jgi:hypothetical protein
MKTLKLVALAVLMTAFCFGQTAMSTTTLGAAITSTSTTTITLASTSSMLSSGPANQIQTALYVDLEFMPVVTVIDSTHALVQRGKNQTRPALHASGATVYYGNPVGNFFSNAPPQAGTWGACTASTELYLPKIYVTTGQIFDCKRTGVAGTSGQWINISQGTMAVAGQRVSNFCTGSVAAGETEFLNGAACNGATTATARQVMTSPGTLANLYAVAGTAPSGGTNKDVLTVTVNGTGTAITCTFGGAGATTCNDVTHSVQVFPGDVVTFSFVTMTSTDAAANVAAVVGVY